MPRILPMLLFLALLLLPTVARISGYPRVAPLEEYRALAEWPKASDHLPRGKPGFLAYTAQLNRWHLDNFPTRAFWVRLRTQVLYSVFRYSDQVHVGPDNWLYYRSVIDVETPQVERISPEARQQLVARIARLSELLDRRGIRLHVMPMALKSRFYPEFLPATARHARDFRFYDDFMDELVASRKVRVVDPRGPLLAAKQRGLKIFHQTDFHWTDPAAPEVLHGMLHDMGRDEGLVGLVEDWDYEVLVEPAFVGGQGRALPLLRTPTERTVMIKPVRPETRFDYSINRDGIEWSGVAQPGQEARLKPLLVYGDSFMDAAGRAGFYGFFGSFSRARIGQKDLVHAYRHRPEGTRYLLLEWITSATFGIDRDVAALVAELEREPPPAR